MDQASSYPNPTSSLTALLDVATPELYQRNAFRIVEMRTDASPRELDRRQKMIEMAANTGVPVPPGSSRLLPLQGTIDSALLRESVNQLRNPEARLIHEFFWFAQDPNDNAALDALGRGELEEAIRLGRTQADSGNAIAIHNMAVLMHALALDLEPTSGDRSQLDTYWRDSLKYWRSLLSAEAFWHFLVERVRALDDPRLTEETVNQLRFTLPLALLSINAQFARQAAENSDQTTAKRHIRLISLSGFEPGYIEQAIQRVVEPVRDRIKTWSSAADSESTANPTASPEIMTRLIGQTTSSLAILDNLLPPGHAIRDSMHDEVAKQILGGAIVYGNKTEDWPGALALIERATALAATSAMRDRIAENAERAKNNKTFGMCWYCGKHPAKEECKHEVKMFGDVQRIPTGYNQVRVTWRTATLKVPRCPDCKDAHKRVNNWVTSGCVVGALPAILAGIAFATSFATGSSSKDRGMNQFIGFICGSGVITLIVIGIMMALTTQFILKPRSIRGEGEVQQYPPILDLKKQGWQMGEKPATK